MGNEITYLDLIVLRKIDSESTVEKFGMNINTSFFDAANLLGSIKIKGLIDIQSSVGGQSPIMITGEGKDLLSNAIQLAAEPINSLDQAILNTLVTGVRDLPSLQNAINIRSKDLAFHLYKLKSYDYVDDTIQSAKVSFSLTEKGFLLTRSYRASGNAATMAPKKEEEKKEEIADKTPKPTVENEIMDLFNLSAFKRTAAKKAPVSGIGEDEAPAAHNALAGGAKDKTGGKERHAEAAGRAEAAHGAHAGLVVPQKPATPPWLKKDGDVFAPKKLDKSRMLASKLEYYVQKYWIFGLLLFLLVAILVVAIVFAIILQ